jgi:excisionase family DNA binding protein
MPALEPLALSPRDAAALLSISKRSLSRLTAARKIAARKDGSRTLVDVASVKAYYASLPLKTDHAPSVGRDRLLAPTLNKGRLEIRGVVGLRGPA